jgi:hypothetical protein
MLYALCSKCDLRGDLPALINNFIAFLAVANALAVLEHPPSHTSGISAFATHHHEVGNWDRVLLFHDTSLATVCPWPHVALDKIDFLHYGPVFLGKNLQNFAGLTLFFPGNNHNYIVSFDMVSLFLCHQISLSVSPDIL